MTSVIYLGSLEGESVLLHGGFRCGRVRHSLRIYRDDKRGNTIGIGRIWGKESLLENLTTGQSANLRLNGETVPFVVQRKSVDEGYICVGIEGAVPGF